MESYRIASTQPDLSPNLLAITMEVAPRTVCLVMSNYSNSLPRKDPVLRILRAATSIHYSKWMKVIWQVIADWAVWKRLKLIQVDLGLVTVIMLAQPSILRVNNSHLRWFNQPLFELVCRLHNNKVIRPNSRNKQMEEVLEN